MDGDAEWWRDAVIYQVYTASFADADGDGIGDIAGIFGTSCPTLAALGVDALWINPWYASPQADAGYDVRTTATSNRSSARSVTLEMMIADALGCGLRRRSRHRPQPHIGPARVVPRRAGS